MKEKHNRTALAKSDDEPKKKRDRMHTFEAADDVHEMMLAARACGFTDVDMANAALRLSLPGILRDRAQQLVQASGAASASAGTGAGHYPPGNSPGTAGSHLNEKPRKKK